MNYEKLIETISVIVENPNIVKEGLTLLYELDPISHKKMNEHLFYKANPTGRDFKPSDEFEVELGGILIRFIKRKPQEDLESSE